MFYFLWAGRRDVLGTARDRANLYNVYGCYFGFLAPRALQTRARGAWVRFALAWKSVASWYVVEKYAGKVQKKQRPGSGPAGCICEESAGTALWSCVFTSFSPRLSFATLLCLLLWVCEVAG
jgi:hypothetical protein